MSDEFPIALYGRLRTANYIAGLVHSAMAVSIAIVGVLQHAPYELNLDVHRADSAKLLDAAPYLKSPYCGNVKYTNVFQWFDCLRDTTNLTDTRREFENARTNTVTDNVYSQKVWMFLASFAATTAAFHFALYLLNDVYRSWLEQRIQPLRWMEYASTYTTMTVCLFALNQQTDIYLYALLVASSMAQMWIGYAIEYTNRPPVKFTRRWRQQDCCEIYTCERLDVSPGVHFFSRSYFTRRDWPKLFLHWALYQVSFLIMASHFYILWDSFMDAFEPYFEHDSADLWKQLYGFIFVLNVFIVLAYLVFPVIHLATYFVRSTRCYVIGEFAYILASMTAKVGLIAIVFSGIQRRP